MKSLLYLSVPVSTLIVAIVCIVLSLVGLKIVRKKISRERLAENHEVAGFIFNAFGLVYAVLLAFVVFANWSNYDNSKKNIEKEANKLYDIFIDAQGFPDSSKKNIQGAVIDYTNKVVKYEWNTMEEGEFSDTARESFERLWEIFLSIDPNKLPNQYAYQESFKVFNELSEYRRLRIFDVNDTTPALIWVIVIIGAIISVGYTYFFGSRNMKAQYVMTSALALTNSLILYLIYVLDHPFTGYNKIPPEAFNDIIKIFNHLMTGN